MGKKSLRVYSPQPLVRFRAWDSWTASSPDGMRARRHLSLSRSCIKMGSSSACCQMAALTRGPWRAPITFGQAKVLAPCSQCKGIAY